MLGWGRPSRPGSSCRRRRSVSRRAIAGGRRGPMAVQVAGPGQSRRAAWWAASGWRGWGGWRRSELVVVMAEAEKIWSFGTNTHVRAHRQYLPSSPITHCAMPYTSLHLLPAITKPTETANHGEITSQRRRPVRANPASHVVRPSCEALAAPTVITTDAIHGSHHKNACPRTRAPFLYSGCQLALPIPLSLHLHRQTAAPSLKPSE